MTSDLQVADISLVQCVGKNASVTGMAISHFTLNCVLMHARCAYLFDTCGFLCCALLTQGKFLSLREEVTVLSSKLWEDSPCNY